MPAKVEETAVRDVLITAEEAAEQLDVPVATMEQRKTLRQFEAVSHGGRWYYRQSVIETQGHKLKRVWFSNGSNVLRDRYQRWKKIAIFLASVPEGEHGPTRDEVAEKFGLSPRHTTADLHAIRDFLEVERVIVSTSLVRKRGYRLTNARVVSVQVRPRANGAMKDEE